MRLRRLELQGFKSFVDRTILPFDEGITGVVGPNGCGKSNIVDAIQWVMGEQSAKHLRGDSMSDVIFNGSDNRSATSMAEVTLVLDVEGTNLPPHLLPIAKKEELAITRRLFRDGTAEYLLNKNSVRLRDVHEVFMDTGVGRRAYSIIEQGQISRMVNVKPDDRRGIFEEVAGITKYKTKRKEAERKLEQTRLNISRVEDIIRELEKQIRSLKIQSTRARKYKEIKKELETIDLFVLGRKLHSLHEGMESLKREREELQTQRAEVEALCSTLDARVTELDVLRIDQEKKSHELEGHERELTLLVQRLENQLILLDQQRNHLKQAIEARAQELEEIQQTEAEMGKQNEKLSQERSELDEALNALAKVISESDIAFQEIQGEKDTLDNTYNEQQAALAEHTKKIVYFENQIEHGTTKQADFLTRSETLNEKLTQAVLKIDQQKKNLNEVEEKIDSCQARGETLEKEAASLHEECEQSSRSLSETEKRLFELRESFHAKRSRWESLKELQENLEGYSPTAKEILLKAEGAISATPLADILNPDEEVEELLEALLGDAMNTLIVNRRSEALDLANIIHERGLERVGILALEAIRTTTERNENQPQQLVSQLGRLRSRVKVKEGYERIADHWLDHVYCCSSRSEAFEYQEQLPEFTFVTEDGQVIADRSGGLSCGTLPSKRGIFARRREIEELGQICESLESNVAETEKKREELLRLLESQEAQHAELKDKLSGVHIESVELRKEKEKIQLESERADSEYTLYSEESEKNSAQLEKIKSQLEEWKQQLNDTSGEQDMIKQRLDSLEAERVILEQKAEDINLRIHTKKIEKTKLEEKVISLSEKLQKLESDLAHFRQRFELLQEKNGEDTTKIEEIDHSEIQQKEEKETTSQKQGELVAKLSELKNAYAETCHNLSEFRQQKEVKQRERDENLSLTQEVEVRLAQEQSTYEYQKNIAIERYQKEAAMLDETATLDLEQLPLLSSQSGKTWNELSIEERESILDDHLENLRKKIERYGEVNLTAIHEFDEVQKRYDFLTEQKQDLENSIQILERAIKKIDETTKQRFSETFHGVNAKFKEVFPILFNGGKAELALTSPDDILESGVDIMAQPPGKRLQSITLLSGGEKALTAVSLVLAIFALKPSPFCLLDEVDAPLDEANVSRFNTVIKTHGEEESVYTRDT